MNAIDLDGDGDDDADDGDDDEHGNHDARRFGLSECAQILDMTIPKLKF